MFDVVFVTQLEVREKKKGYVEFLRQQVTSIERGSETPL